ncbi:hypothetical protein VNO77_44528 [Canavalia gladiata]|uniref:Uncharacterized protein n=1 Tax=Canavalia gladiata TaxID=3824 RepID=A0AAN9JZV1_CANGL
MDQGDYLTPITKNLVTLIQGQWLMEEYDARWCEDDEISKKSPSRRSQRNQFLPLSSINSSPPSFRENTFFLKIQLLLFCSPPQLQEPVSKTKGSLSTLNKINFPPFFLNHNVFYLEPNKRVGVLICVFKGGDGNLPVFLTLRASSLSTYSSLTHSQLTHKVCVFFTINQMGMVGVCNCRLCPGLSTYINLPEVPLVGHITEANREWLLCTFKKVWNSLCV